MNIPTAESALRLFRSGQIDGALEEIETGLHFSKSGSEDFWKFQFVRADCLRARGLGKKAIDLFRSFAENEGLAVDLRALHHIHYGYLLGMQNRYAEAIKEFGCAEDIAQLQTVSHSTFVELNLRRGMVFFFASHISRSEESYRVALNLCGADADRFSEAVARAGIGKNAMARGNHELAIQWYTEALEIANSIGAVLFAAAMKSELGWCAYGLNHDGEALRLFREAEIVLRHSGAIPNYQICLGNIGNVYLRTGDWLNAVSYYQRALRLAHEVDDLLSSAKWLNNLAIVFSKMGNPVVASEYDRQARVLKQNLKDERDRLDSQLNQ